MITQIRDKVITTRGEREEEKKGSTIYDQFNLYIHIYQTKLHTDNETDLSPISSELKLIQVKTFVRYGPIPIMLILSYFSHLYVICNFRVLLICHSS